MKPNLGRFLTVPVVLAVAACAATRDPAATPAPTVASPAWKRTACGSTQPRGCVEPSPSFARDVAPILERRCFACHANGGIAADDHDFSRFATLHAQKDAVIVEVSACAMPPSDAPTTLALDEADTLLQWAACGAPQN
jgi:hypothetical protein